MAAEDEDVWAVAEDRVLEDIDDLRTA